MSTDLHNHLREGGTVADDETASDDSAVSDGPPESPVADEPRATGGRGRRDLVLVLVGVLVAVLGLGAWWVVDNDGAYTQAEERDTVVVEATHAIEVLNTLDHREVEEGIDSWRSVSTGTLADQLAAVGEDELTLLAEQAKISTGEVVDAAVLDLDGTTATLLAAVEVTVVDDSGDGDDAEPEVKRNRFSADLEKVDGEWKLSALQQLAVNL
ncbi:hypothetical protein [Aeromicrobium sp. CTD01-1L150]|uniref:hypothetical protein n=1 Tax=Aeromicrobium sp. CTD01-1L150 TaxID=3341830 RepID=UPI0035C14F34